MDRAAGVAYFERGLTTGSQFMNAGVAAVPAGTMHLPRERRLSLFGLVSVAFFTTNGGAFGLEPLVGQVGPGLAILLIVATPLIWSLPMALMVAELATLMPEEGGYYIWVRETLGPFWAVQETFWTIGYSIALTAIFPVLFVNYLGYFVPALGPAGDAAHPGANALVKWLIAAAVIVTATAVNLRGAKDVGSWAKWSGLFIVGVFATVVLAWWGRGLGSGEAVAAVRGVSWQHPGALLLGLSTIVFNYSGWDNISPFAAEVDEPQRNYPRALGIVMVVGMLGYLLPVIAGVSVTSDPAVWSADAGWPVISRMIGGPWLGTLVAVAALVSTWNLFNSQVLYLSRLPYVMAVDGWFPKAFANISSHAAAPKFAIGCIGALTVLFAGLSFGSLALIQCLLYTAALVLEYLALIILRVRRPEAPRTFRVPGGWWGIGYVCLLPMAAGAVVLVETLKDWAAFQGQLLVVALILASGVAVYFLRRGKALAKG
jgi:amino acid transporter